jgi:putative selenium metabolism protein SsnA
VTLALTGGTVLTSLSPPRLVEADVVIDGDRISAVGTAASGTARRDCSGCLIIPGNVCAHTHLYSALARGMPFHLEPPANFLQILQRVWWRLDRALDAESIRASALVGGMEALLCGTTALVDHHASPNAIDGSLDVIADALQELGLRSVLCYEVTDRDGPDRARAGIEENRRFASGSTVRPMARSMIGAHASFTLSDETLAACAALAEETRAGIHIHVAEDGADQGDSESRFAMPVVERLAKAGALNERALLAHCVHVHPSEIELISDSGATVAHSARSNMNNGVGRAPVEAFSAARVALGTDGIGADMFDESRSAYWRTREESLDQGPSLTMERLGTGARFAGQAFGEPLLGRIEPGAPADLSVLDYSAPTPLEDGTIAGHWFFGLSSRHVRDVMVAGELVVADRRLTGLDQDKVAAEASAAAGRMWRRLEDIPAHSFQPAGDL